MEPSRPVQACNGTALSLLQQSTCEHANVVLQHSRSDFLIIFHCRYFHLYSQSHYSFPHVYKYLCSEIGCRNNFVTYLCTPCIYCLCNKSIKNTKSCFIIILLYSSTCFEHYCAHHTLQVAVRCTGRPPTECDDTRCCTIQFLPPDDEHNSARNMQRNIINLL